MTDDALSIFRFLRDRVGAGQGAVLVTLTAVTGSGARAPGAHMAVAEDGTALGSFSGGCVEAAVIGEALEALASGEARQVRYGAGSRYIDIRLPCGGAIDLLFTPLRDAAVIGTACAILEKRQPLALTLTRGGGIEAHAARDGEGSGWAGRGFVARHSPALRLVVMGHGAEPLALMRVADAYGASTMLLSPDRRLVDEARRTGHHAEPLRILGPSSHFAADHWTAVVALFHDHEWETALLTQALEATPFFIGAMGSWHTHAERCRRLVQSGVDPGRVAAIVGPIGLIKATRDPATLAVSIIAQVVEAYGRAVAATMPRCRRAEAA